MKPEVVDIMKRYAAAEGASVSFSNLAKAFLDKHVSENELGDKSVGLLLDETVY